MKNPPTLADALIALSLRKKTSVDVAKHCRAMLPARKFVIDHSMTRWLIDAEMDLLSKGTQRKQLRVMDMIRRQSRLPHEITWIEMDVLAMRKYTIERYGFTVKPGVRSALRRGWLLQQHPAIETAFKCWDYTAHDSLDDLHASRLGYAWCCDDSTQVPWRQYQAPFSWRAADIGRQTARSTTGPIILDDGECPADYEWSDAELLAGMTGFITPQVHLIDAHHLFDEKEPGSIWKLRASLRLIWLLLATINDLPISFQDIRPSHGFIARGSYKKFVTHSVIRLTVPETRWRKLTAKVLAILRRRAHQVRGHWRKDWRNPLSPGCEHIFDDDMVCKRCHGHQIWIAEHQRGDASIGFVSHDYEVHHESRASK
jgi:hypothetical protein